MRVFRFVLSTFVHQHFQSGKLQSAWETEKRRVEALENPKGIFVQVIAPYVFFSQGMSRERVPRVLSLPIDKVVEGR